MQLIVVGTNHKKSPLNIREKLSITEKEQINILLDIKEYEGISEGLVLSTCNRTELYFVTEDDNTDNVKNFTLNKLHEMSKVPIEDLKKYLYTYYDLELVNHLYRVASGLDSLIIGECQILGQLKSAFEKANSVGSVDTFLHKLFTESFQVGKKARNETKICRNAASVSSAAVELARDTFGTLAGESVMILGAGETSELTLKNLVDYGVKGVMVANRTYQRGKELAEKFNGEVIHWEEIESWIDEIDIIIGSTAAPHYVLHYDLIEKVMKIKKGPLFLIDIAVPRDIEPEVSEIPGVHLYDIDDLEGVVEDNLSSRKKEVVRVEKIIEQKVNEFINWWKIRKSVPVIKKMRKKAEKVKNEELDRALHQLSASEMDPEEVVKSLAHRLTNKVLHQPTVGVKKMAKGKKGGQKIDVVEELFSD